MKVFVSWSGDTSREVALALRDWLPSVIQIVEPYVSSEDIDKGARWNTDISRELEGSSFGILCVTRDNIHAPWINFEAGALSKSLEQARVAPFLLGVQRTDVTGPLLQFQSTIYEHADVLKLVRSINAACSEHALEETRLDNVFDVWWSKLQERIDAIDLSSDSSPTPSRSSDDVLSEVLELVRNQQGMLSDLALDAGNTDRFPRRHPALEEVAFRWGELERLLFLDPAVSGEVREAAFAISAPLEFIFDRAGIDPRASHRRPSRAEAQRRAALRRAAAAEATDADGTDKT